MKSFRRISEKAGLTPGALVHVGAPSTREVQLELVSYGPDVCERRQGASLDAVIDGFDQERVNWIHVDGLHDPDMILQIGQRFQLHLLLLEDIMNTDHLPKLEEYDNALFLTLKYLDSQADDLESSMRQANLILAPNLVISLCEQPSPLFDSVRDRIVTGAGKIRQRQADYLFHRLTDAIVDDYYRLLDRWRVEIEELEEELSEGAEDGIMPPVQRLKRDVLLFRRVVAPLREGVVRVVREEFDLVQSSTLPYFRDINDHLDYVMDTVFLNRDLLAELKELYLANISNRMNQVMKTLTIIATIFIPLTFLAGIYGMNFQYMPELRWKWGYPALLLIMLALAGGMIILMRRKKWL